MAVVTGVRNFVRLFGSTISLAICASIVNNTLRAAIEPLGLTAEQVSALLDDPTIINNPSKIDLTANEKAVIIAGYTKGFHSVFYLTIACIMTAFLASVFMIEQLELNRADDQELKRKGKEFQQERKKKKIHAQTEVEAAVSVISECENRDTDAEKTVIHEKGENKGDIKSLSTYMAGVNAEPKDAKVALATT